MFTQNLNDRFCVLSHTPFRPGKRNIQARWQPKSLEMTSQQRNEPSPRLTTTRTCPGLVSADVRSPSGLRKDLGSPAGDSWFSTVNEAQKEKKDLAQAHGWAQHVAHGRRFCGFSPAPRLVWKGSHSALCETEWFASIGRPTGIR